MIAGVHWTFHDSPDFCSGILMSYFSRAEFGIVHVTEAAISAVVASAGGGVAADVRRAW